MSQHLVEDHGGVLANDDTRIGGIREIGAEPDGAGINQDAAAESIGDGGGGVREREAADEVIVGIC